MSHLICKITLFCAVYEQIIGFNFCLKCCNYCVPIWSVSKRMAIFFCVCVDFITAIPTLNTGYLILAFHNRRTFSYDGATCCSGTRTNLVFGFNCTTRRSRSCSILLVRLCLKTPIAYQGSDVWLFWDKTCCCDCFLDLISPSVSKCKQNG